MIQLPNAGSCSELKVHPKNWQSPKAACKKDWYERAAYITTQVARFCGEHRIIIDPDIGKSANIYQGNKMILNKVVLL